jgi:hypothetical protein
MKFQSYLNNLLLDLDSFIPASLTNIVDFVRNNVNYNKIVIFLQNSSKSKNILIDELCFLINENNPASDVQLAGLFVVIADVDYILFKNVVSSSSGGLDNYKWSSAMTASYLIHQEVLSETIRQSA